jgi:polyribonucleotide nucleotidyltransferase
MLVLEAENLDRIHEFHVVLAQSGLMKWARQPYSFLGLRKASEYSDEERQIPRRFKGKYLFVYPFVKTREWYGLEAGERWRIMQEHIAVGREYPTVDNHKVAGTREFVTAIQLDTKLDGIPADVLAGALTQARDARLHILDVMNEAIDAPDEMSPYAPRVISVQVPVDKIGEVIGPKGKMINQIQDETGAQISIEDDGTVYIGATDGPSAEAARAMINAIANPQMPEIGERFLGTVVKTTTFGAFISLLPGKDGLLHISEVRKLVGGKRIDNVEDVLAVGQKVQVELKEIDPRGKLSLAAVLAEGDSGDEQAAAADSAPVEQAAAPVPADGETGSDTGSDTGSGADDAGDARDGEERGERRPRNRRRGGNRGRGDRSGEGSGESVPADA